VRNTQPTKSAKPDFSQDIRVKYAVLCATLAVIALGVLLSWGKWLELFYISAAPLVILTAWFRWRRRLSAWSLIPAACLAALQLVIFWNHQVCHVADPRTYDLQLFFVDGSFGFEPSIWVRHTVDRVPLLNRFFFWVYNCLPLAMAFAYVAHLKNRKGLLYIPAVLGIALIGTLLYDVLPACGPVFLLGTHQFAGDCGTLCSNISAISGDRDSYSFDATWPRNAMPSLHVTWALLIFWICRDLRRGRWLAGAFLISTALSTLVTGEHYLVDVIVAFPLALVVWQVCVGEGSIGHPRRVLPIMAGGLMLILWLTAIRFTPQVFWLSPVLPWSAAIATISCSLLIVSRHPDRRFMLSEGDSEKAKS
jgi:hypothetical protein